MYDYGVPESEGLFTGLGVAAVVLVILLFIILLAVVVLVIIANCKIFTKAGEKWWKALVPLYNSWVQFKIAGLGWWWFPIFAVLTHITLNDPESVSWVASVGLFLTSFNVCYGYAKKFGKSDGFAVLMAFLPVVGLPILGFGKAEYNKDAEVDKNGIFKI